MVVETSCWGYICVWGVGGYGSWQSGYSVERKMEEQGGWDGMGGGIGIVLGGERKYGELISTD